MRLEGPLDKNGPGKKCLEGDRFSGNAYFLTVGDPTRPESGMSWLSVRYRQRRLCAPRASARLQMALYPSASTSVPVIPSILTHASLGSVVGITNSASTRSANVCFFLAMKQR